MSGASHRTTGVSSRQGPRPTRPRFELAHAPNPILNAQHLERINTTKYDVTCGLQELKDVWARQPNPHDKGCWKNVENALFIPVRASYMREGAEDDLAGSTLADDWEEARTENNAARNSA